MASSYLSERVRALIHLDSHSQTLYTIHSDPLLSISSKGDASPLSGIYAFSTHSHEYIRSFSCLEGGLEWLLYPSEWENLLTLHPFNDMDVREVLLWMTMDLERSLGNILFSLGLQVPHLLKDVLQNESLLECIGEVHGEILGSLMGSPDTLNLRNLLWHGFASINELHSAYVSGILVVASAIGNRLNDVEGLVLRRRPFSDILERCASFPSRLRMDINGEECPPGMERVLDLYAEGDYGLSLLSFLPHLESSLRCLFTEVNDVPQRLLTAEADSLYTTFDEIFAAEVDASRGSDDEVPQVNKLREQLGDPLLEFYYDILFLPDGPRLRDRLSHGEFLLFQDPEAFRVPLNLLLRSFLSPEDFDSYKAIFHPFSLLFQRVSEATEDVLCAGEPLLMDKGLPSGIAEYSCLFRPKGELELVRILLQIAEAVGFSARAVKENRSITLSKIENKSLRSRQRLTAERMFDCIQGLRMAQMETLSYLLLVFGAKDVMDFNLKNLRRILSLHQNISTWAKHDQNHWDRIRSALKDLKELLRHT